MLANCVYIKSTSLKYIVKKRQEYNEFHKTSLTLGAENYLL